MTDGRLLVTTITSDDPDWARRGWGSIAFHDVPPILRPMRNLALRPTARSRRRRR